MATKAASKTARSITPTLDIPQGLVQNEVGAWALITATGDEEGQAALDVLLATRTIARTLSAVATDRLADIKRLEDEWRSCQARGGTADEILAINRAIAEAQAEHAIATFTPMGARHFVRNPVIDRIAAGGEASALAYVLATEYPDRLGSWLRAFESVALPATGQAQHAEAAREARADAVAMASARPDRRANISKVVTNWDDALDLARQRAKVLLGEA
jgi:hypothetical protein